MKQGASPHEWELWASWVGKLQSPAGDAMIRGCLLGGSNRVVGALRYAARTLLRQDALSDESRVTLLRFVRRHDLIRW